MQEIVVILGYKKIIIGGNNMAEEWKDIEGYEGLYQVSSMGRVKSLKRTCNIKGGGKRTVGERILKPDATEYGYLRVNLYTGGKQKKFRVHRLVAYAFVPNPEGKPEINHRDEDKTNNSAANLEWCTREENMNYGTIRERIGKKTAQALSKPVGQYTIDGKLLKLWPSATIAGRQTGFDKSRISKTANGKCKTHKGFVWKYIS